MVPQAGLEPARPCGQQILRLLLHFRKRLLIQAVNSHQSRGTNAVSEVVSALMNSESFFHSALAARKVGSLARLLAIRRASFMVSTLAMSASALVSRASRLRVLTANLCVSSMGRDAGKRRCRG